MSKPTIYFSILVIFLSGCNTTKYISKGHSNQIQKETTLLLSPRSNLSLVSEKNQLVASDSLVDISNKIMAYSIENMSSTIGITESSHSGTSSEEIIYLSQECLDILQYFGTKIRPQDKKRFLTSYVTHAKTDSVMSKLGIETVLLFVHSGFKRSKQNKNKQNMKSLGVGLLTLGMYVPISYPYSSDIQVLALSKGNGIAFYNSTIAQKDPTENSQIEQRMCELLQGYLSKRSSTGACFYPQI